MGYIDDFIAKAEKDQREGIHEVTVQENQVKTWDDGRTSANLAMSIDVGGKVFLNLPSGPLPTESELKAIEESGDMRKLKGTSFGLRLRKQMSGLYGIDDPANIETGFSFHADLRKDKKTGYIKVDKIVGKGGGKAAAPQANDAPDF